MVPVGVVGLSPAWETRYLPAICSLRERIAIRAIYDPVVSRAEQAAAEFDAQVVTGMRSLARRSDLKALLVLDRGWCGNEAIRLLCDAGRPMFVGGAIATDGESLDRLRTTVATCGTTVMPELGQRYTAATIRLRELMATQLGRPRHIEIEADAPAVPAGGQPLGSQPWNEFVSRLTDWCCAVVPTSPVAIEAAEEGPRGPETIRLQFAQPRSGGERPTVTIHLRAATAAASSHGLTPVYRITCLRGSAEILSTHRIVWRSHESAGDESLTAERTELQVMLDHFCRRVVGGLIPVADLADVRRSWILAQAAAESLRRGGPVRLNGRMD